MNYLVEQGRDGLNSASYRPSLEVLTGKLETEAAKHLRAKAAAFLRISSLEPCISDSLKHGSKWPIQINSAAEDAPPIRNDRRR